MSTEACETIAIADLRFAIKEGARIVTSKLQIANCKLQIRPILVRHDHNLHSAALRFRGLWLGVAEADRDDAFHVHAFEHQVAGHRVRDLGRPTGRGRAQWALVDGGQE